MSRLQLVMLLALAGTALAGDRVRLKTRTVVTSDVAGSGMATLSDRAMPATAAAAPFFAAPVHLLAQFSEQPTPQRIRDLELWGARVLGYVPDDAVVISMPMGIGMEQAGVKWLAALKPEDKLSPALSGAGEQTVLVEFHPDIDLVRARTVFLEKGIAAVEHAGLAPGHLLAKLVPNQIRALAEDDSVAYIFPASRDLEAGGPVMACISGMTPFGRAAQYAAAVGQGWPHDHAGPVSLRYVLPEIPAALPTDAARAEIIRALETWSRYVEVNFTPGQDGDAAATIKFLFASRDHGDGFPFDGPRGTLAHTFYPAPPNPEPLAGDMHLDSDESWNIGFDIDLFSVALHETGHALGLAHSDNPDSVMYPYYRMASDLKPDDISSIRSVYTPRGDSPSEPTGGTPTVPETPKQPTIPDPPKPVPPLGLTVNAVPATVSSDRIALSGTTTGGSGEIVVTWTGESGVGVASGASVWSADVPLVAGRNTIAITAADSAGNHVSSMVALTRAPGQDKPARGGDTTAPTIVIRTPSSSNVSLSSSSMTVSGTATDNIGVKAVYWSTAAGDAGIASGTEQWSTGSIPLLVGMNVVVIRAFDTSGNMSWRTIAVTRH